MTDRRARVPARPPTGFLSRRALLRLLGSPLLLAAGGAVGGGPGLACGPGEAPEPIGELLAELAEGRRLGRDYLAAHPGERSRAVLRAALLPEGRPSRTEIEGHLARRIDTDLERGALVAVDRWLLTRTEARLLALSALSAAGPD